MHTSRTAIAALSLALVGCADPVVPPPAPSAARSSADAPVPFRGSLEGAEQGTLIAPATVRMTAEWHGNASHLGRYTVSAGGVIQLATGTAELTLAFVAANGDLLFAEATGLSAPTADPGVHLITERARITGGTGRFAGATGSFTIVRLVRLSTGVSSGSIDGSISLAR